MTLVDAVRQHVLDDHRDTLARVATARDAVVAGWDGAAADRSDVVPPMREELDRRGVRSELVDVLTGAISAAGETLPASPVAAPPYVVVASVGPVLRATLSSARLVLTIRAFEVVRGDGPRYRPGPSDFDAMLEVTAR